MASPTKLLILPVSLLSLTLISGIILSSNLTHAADDTSTIDTLNVTVNPACTLKGGSSGTTSTTNTYSASINAGNYAEISGSRLTTLCNDPAGYAIYAIGYSGDSYDSATHTDLIGNETTGNIATGTSGDNSYWAMKLEPVTGLTPPTIITDFQNYHVVPDAYTRVVEYGSNTATPSSDGATVQAKYKINISRSQLAGTYIGKVKYTMVHPNDTLTPSTINLQSSAVKEIIDDNIMFNPDFYALQEQTVDALKSSPNIPEEYKQYLKTTDIKGNPKCDRTDLVEKIKAVTTLTTKEENALLNDDTINVLGEPVDLRVFDKNIDGVYANNVKLIGFEFSGNSVSDYPAYLHRATKSDILSFFDFEGFNKASSTSELYNADNYVLTRNVKNFPESYGFQISGDYSIDYGRFDSVDISAYDRTPSFTCNKVHIDDVCEVINTDFNLALQNGITLYTDTDVEVTPSDDLLTIGEYANNPEWFCADMFNRQFSDINDIIDNYVNTVRYLLYDIYNIEVFNNGNHYAGPEQVSGLASLTLEDFWNIHSYVSEEEEGEFYDGCADYGLTCSRENYEKALDKLKL